MTDPREGLAMAILAALRSSPRPLKRRELADLCGPHGVKICTAERRIREAMEWLVWHGHPVMSDGSGFVLARTAAQFEAALRLREKAVRAEAQKLKRLRGMLHRMCYPAEASMPALPFQAAPSEARR